MAEDKKGFLLYADYINTVSKLPDDKAGQLFKTVLAYVNDLNPQVDDLLLQIAFEPIKQQLKRDLKSYEGKIKKYSESGKKGMESRWGKKEENIITNDNNVKKSITKITVNDNVNVNDTVTVNVNDIYKKAEIENSIDFEKVFSEIVSDVVFHEGVAMQVKLPLTKIQESLYEFLNELKLKDDYQKGVKKIKQHFINWIKIQKEKSFAKKENYGATKIKSDRTTQSINPGQDFGKL